MKVRVCYNCDTALPEGCGGLFRDDGAACALNSPGTRPPCYNRPPRLPSVFVDRCATWDGRGIGPNGEPYPIAHGWNCAGCRWLPDGVNLAVNNDSNPEDNHQ